MFGYVLELANLGYQFDCICFQLRKKLLSGCVVYLLEGLTMGRYFSRRPGICPGQGTEWLKEMLLLFACLPAYWWVLQLYGCFSCYHALLTSEAWFFKFPPRTEDPSLPIHPPDLHCQTEIAEAFSRMDRAATGFSTSPPYRHSLWTIQLMQWKPSKYILCKYKHRYLFYLSVIIRINRFVLNMQSTICFKVPSHAWRNAILKNTNYQ